MKKQFSKSLALRLALDAVMLVVLMLLFRKRSISLEFHEIAGLALMGAFAFHLLLNRKWISNMARRMFGGGVPARVRVSSVIGILLVISFAAVGISGVLISKVIFSFNAGGVWKTVHYFSAASALILTGVHLGLHAPLLAGVCRKHGWNKLPLKIAGVLAAVVVFVAGCYNIATTEFTAWLAMPFTTEQTAGETHTLAANSDTVTGATVNAEETAFAQELAHGNGAGGQGGGYGQGAGQTGSLTTALSTIGTFFSITFVFACAAWGADTLLRRLKHPRPSIPPAAC